MKHTNETACEQGKSTALLASLLVALCFAALFCLCGCQESSTANDTVIGSAAYSAGMEYTTEVASDTPLPSHEEAVPSREPAALETAESSTKTAVPKITSSNATAGNNDEPELGYEKETLLVTPTPGATVEEIADALGVEPESVVETNAGFMEVALPSEMTVEAAMETLEEHKDVAAAQPDFIYQIQDELDSKASSAETDKEGEETVLEEETPAETTVEPADETLEEPIEDDGYAPETDDTYMPNDSELTEQWALNSINAFKAWYTVRQSTPKTTVVALIDDGIEATHEDLVGSIQTDDTGALVSYNAIDDSNDVSQRTGSNHGTHVAGIVAAEADNGIGVAGVSLNQKIIPIKVIDDSGSTKTSTLAKAFAFITEHANEYNIRVVNCSVGRVGSSSQVDGILKASIDQAYDEYGITVVCSAGNRNSSQDVPNYNYPSDYSRVVAVINLMQESEAENGVARSAGSNYNRTLDDGSIETAKDISAPGTNIYSTTPNGSYGRSSGTSMAAPCVSGVLAMMFAVNPNLTAEQAIELLYSTARDLNEAGFDDETGYGEVDAAAAVDAATTAQGSFELAPAPTSEEEVPSSNEADDSVDPKENAGGVTEKATIPTPRYVVGASKMPVGSTSTWKLKNGTMKVVSGKGVVSIAKDGVTVKAKKKGTAKVAIYNKAGKKVKTQKIKVYQFGGAYTLNSAKASKLCVSVKNDSKRANATAIAAKKVGKTSQAVKLTWNNGYYRLKMMGSKKYLAPKAASKKNGALIVQAKKPSSKAQQWKISVDGKNRLTFTNRNSGKVLTIKGKVATGAQLVQTSPTTHLRAKWVATR